MKISNRNFFVRCGARPLTLLRTSQNGEIPPMKGPTGGLAWSGNSQPTNSSHPPGGLHPRTTWKPPGQNGWPATPQRHPCPVSGTQMPTKAQKVFLFCRRTIFLRRTIFFREYNYCCFCKHIIILFVNRVTSL